MAGDRISPPPNHATRILQTSTRRELGSDAEAHDARAHERLAPGLALASRPRRGGHGRPAMAMKKEFSVTRQKVVTILVVLAATCMARASGPKWNVQLQVTPTIPALLKKALF
jgi:hypothetical protein